MGQFSNEIANRFKTYGPPKGFCAICRLFRSRTRGHVPPKNCGNVRKSVIQDLFGDSVAHATRARNVPTFSQTGSHFETPCGECNDTRLGTLYDPALGAVIHPWHRATMNPRKSTTTAAYRNQ